MNHELDLVSRLVEYHDHIAAPTVPVVDDLRRGRRRVRRTRGLLAGGVAVGLASLVAAVSLTTGDGTVERPQPTDPPGLIAPLVAPKSLLDVRQLGFHVEPSPGVVPNQGWQLAPDHQATTVEWAGHTLFVRVYYPATGRPDWHLNVGPGQVEEVSIHGISGDYVEQFDSSAGTCGTPPRDCTRWSSELMWQFAPDSWASVEGFAGESPPPQSTIRPAFLKIAEALRSGGGAATRLPFRVGTDRAPLPPIEEAGVGMESFDYDGTRTWRVSLYGEPTLSFSTSSTSCGPESEDAQFAPQRFTYRGHKGCLHFFNGEPSSVALRVGGVNREISNPWVLYGRSGFTTEQVDEVKQWLADLTVASLNDPSTWFDLKSAFGG